MPSVVLLYPRTGWDRQGMVSLPLSVLALGAYLEERHVRVRIIDQRVEPDPNRALADAVRELRPSWVGFSSMTGQQLKGALEAAQVVRSLDASIPLVWGGVHPTLMTEESLSHSLVDLVVRGEGEETAFELTQALEAGGELPAVKGLSGASAEGFWHAPDRAFLDLDTLPLTPTNMVDLAPYLTRQVLGDWDLRINTSRGCPHACAYCYNVPFNNRRWRAQSPERVVEELDHLARGYGVRAFYIGDDDFFANRKRVSEICRLLRERGRPYRLKANSLLDYLVRMPEETLREWHDGGLVELYIGVETASPEILESVNKRIEKQDVLDVNRKLGRVGIVPVYSFMAGFPDETPEHVQETLDLMSQLPRENDHARVTQIHLLAVYPGTPLYPRAAALGLELPKTLEEWSRVHWNRIDYPWLTREQRRFLSDASFFTGFLDGRSLSEYLLGGIFVRGIVSLYAQIVRVRIALRFYRFMPEIRLLGAYVNRKLEAPA